MISNEAANLECKDNCTDTKRTLQSPDSAFGDSDETLPVLNTNADFSVPSFSRVFCANGINDEEANQTANCADSKLEDQLITSHESVFVVDPNISPSTSDAEATMQSAQNNESISNQPFTHLPNSFENLDLAEFLSVISQSCSKPSLVEMMLNTKRRKVSSPRKRMIQPVQNKHKADKKRRSSNNFNLANTGSPCTPSFAQQPLINNFNFPSIEILNKILGGEISSRLLENTNSFHDADSTVDNSSISDMNGAAIASMLMALGVNNEKMMDQDFVANALSNFITISGVVGTGQQMPCLESNDKDDREELEIPKPVNFFETRIVADHKNTLMNHKGAKAAETAQPLHSPKLIQLKSEYTATKPNECDPNLACPLSADLNENDVNKILQLVSNFFFNVSSANVPAEQINLMQVAFNNIFNNNTKTGSSKQQANFVQEFMANLGKFGLESDPLQWCSLKLPSNYTQDGVVTDRPKDVNADIVKSQDHLIENTQPDEKKRKRPRTTSKALFISSSTAKANLLVANNKTVSGNLHGVANSRLCSGAEFLELEDLEEFANNFKKQRIKHGFTQGDVGLALGKRYGTDFSQTTISRFEALNLSYKNMCKLRPLLKEWLEEAETLIQNGATVVDILEAPSPKYHSGQSAHSSEAQNDSGCMEEEGRNGSLNLLVAMPRFLSHSSVPQLKRRRKRTNLDNAQKAALDVFFSDNCRPDHQRMNDIAATLDLDPDVVRVWFCNRRQKIRSKV